MGDIARMERNERFIRILGKALLKRQSIKKGALFEVRDIFLAKTRDGTDVVRVFISLRDQETGDDHEAMLGHTVFDPGATPFRMVEELVDQLSDGDEQETYESWLKGHEQAIALLHKADLLPRGYDVQTHKTFGERESI